MVVSEEVHHVRHTAADDANIELDDAVFCKLELGLHVGILTRLGRLGLGTS